MFEEITMIIPRSSVMEKKKEDNFKLLIIEIRKELNLTL
mgnify:CR=1 FL=1